MTGRVAAVDCGTNSTRLLVAEAAPGAEAGESLRTVVRLMRITRLGQGVGASGNLAPEAIERTAEALRAYRHEIDRLGVPADAAHVRATATSAARDAGNRAELFAAVHDALGVEPELLSGLEEGKLSFEGATEGLDPSAGPFLVADIGGGSTELITGTVDHHGRPRVHDAVSLQLGCVRVTEQHLQHDPPSTSELVAARAAVDALVVPAVDGLAQARAARTVVGLAGTVAAAAAIDAGIAEYDRDQVHHRWLARDGIEALVRRLAGLTVADRKATVVGLEPERADVIVGGLLVLVSLLDALDKSSFLTSEADILDGLAAALLRGERGVP
ncbi:MAG TPA: exopolyphosphatase [Acidimicrobiales bacterium]|nr:exopolyphosphatase [Acidimicrobiales bacterium]